MFSISKKEALKNRKIFTDALRSEKYKQGTKEYRQYRNDEYFYCCLGVLKEVLTPNITWKLVVNNIYCTTDVNSSDNVLLNKCGITYTLRHSLIQANDGEGIYKDNPQTFEQIADMIDSFEVNIR